MARPAERPLTFFVATVEARSTVDVSTSMLMISSWSPAERARFRFPPVREVFTPGSCVRVATSAMRSGREARPLVSTDRASPADLSELDPAGGGLSVVVAPVGASIGNSPAGGMGWFDVSDVFGGEALFDMDEMEAGASMVIGWNKGTGQPGNGWSLASWLICASSGPGFAGSPATNPALG